MGLSSHVKSMCIYCYIPAGTKRWNNVEIYFGTTSWSNFNYILTVLQRHVPAGIAKHTIKARVWVLKAQKTH